MRIDVQHRPSYALAVVHLDVGETIVAEAGSMVSMDSHLQMETSAGKKDEGLVKGLFTGLARMVAGESFFQNRYTAAGRPGTITLAPTHVGDIEVHELDGRTGLVMQSTAYLCSSPEVTTSTKWDGARGFFSGEGAIMLKATGTGHVAFNAFGGVRPIEVDGEFVVDTGHVVAFEDTLTFSVGRFGGGWKAFLFGGEGLVCNFKGKGRLWIQTRNPVAFGEAIGPMLPMRQG